MHVRHLHVVGFKMFRELTVELDTTPRLVVLCDENGSGKSSVIDALASWRLRQFFGIRDPEFFAPGGNPSVGEGQVTIDFHGPVDGDGRAAVYVRTAQRVSVEFQAQMKQRAESTHEPGPERSIDIDDRISEDYDGLVGASIEALWDPSQSATPAGEIVSRLAGDIQAPLGRLIPNLTFEGPDSPHLPSATFRFSRAGLTGYAYKNLSGGEKAVFDLLLDVIVKHRDYNKAVWCIDEPELHVNPRIQGRLLREVLSLIGSDAQLWIATHSPGMLAEARRMSTTEQDSVAFLDFSDRDPTQPLTVRPMTVDREVWRKQLSVALGDLAALIAPERVVLCEGQPDRRDRARARWDARVLEAIFKAEYPTVAFVSVGSADDVVGDRMGVAETVEALVDGVETLRVIDRDARSPQEVEGLREAGCRVLSRRHLEAYVMDVEVLDAVCEALEKPDVKQQLRQALDDALCDSRNRGNPEDDYKSASSHFVTSARTLLGLPQGGNTPPTFLRDTLAPHLKPGMQAYEELASDIFGP